MVGPCRGQQPSVGGRRVMELRDSKELARGAIVGIGGKGLGRIIQLSLQVILARSLGPAAYGLYALGWTLLRMASVLGSMGLNNGVIRFARSGRALGEATGGHRVAMEGVGLALVAGIGLGGATWALADWIATDALRTPQLTGVLQSFAIGFPLAAALRVAAAATLVSRRPIYSVVAEDIGRPLVTILIVLPLLLLGRSVEEIADGTVVAIGVAALMSIGFVRRVLPPGNERADRRTGTAWQLLRFSFPTALAAVFSVFLTWIDRLFVAYYLESAAVGVYQAVSQTAVMFTVILSGINAIFTPIAAAMWREGDIARLTRFYRTSTRWGLYLGMLPLLVIGSVPTAVVTCLYGTQYEAGAAALVILSVGQMLHVAAGGANVVLIMADRQREWMALSTLAVCANVLLNWVLVPSWGIEGAALATAASVGILFVPAVLRLRRLFNMWPYDLSTLKCAAAAVVACATAVTLTASIGTSGGTSLLLSGAVCTAGWIGMLRLLGIDDDDRILWKAVRQRMARPRERRED